MIRRLAFVGACALAFSTAACGKPFDVKTPDGFVELEDQAPSYDYRATTPEGVVVSVRAVDDGGDRGDLAFWTRAVTLQLRDASGYALLATEDVKSADGTPGKRLHFGHDEDGKPFLYDVTILQAQGRIFLVEAGGSKDKVDKARAGIAYLEDHVKVRCGSFVAPVLASRTCNRW